MATTEDEASKSMAEAKKRVKVLRRELKDAHWQLGKAFEEGG